jgi:hypothetical protein
MFRIAVIIAFALSSLYVNSQTSVAGGIYQNTTWTLANSPYIVTGSIVVFPGNTLTIEPGVEIQIDNQTNSSIYIETRGTLNCVGTDLQPITIHAMYDTLNTVAWQGFVCTSSQGGILNADRFHISNAHTPFGYETPLTNYQYTNCVFSHCFEAITVANAVNLQNCQFIDNEVGVYGWSYFTIDNCLFKDNTTSIFAYATALQLTNSNFIDNQIGLTFAAYVFDSIAIADCQFINNELALGSPNNGTVQDCLFSDNTTAIQMASDCELFNNEFSNNELALELSVNADIHDNQINNNAGGLLISNVSLAQDSPLIYNNEICSNSNYNVNNNTNMNYSLLTNCFCGIDSATIELYLIDGYDDITKGLINYSMYDSTCTSVLGTVSKFQDQSAGLSNALLSIDSYTNPVMDYLTIFQETAIEQLRIYTTNGQIITAEPISPNVFDLQFLTPGMYFVQGVQENAVTSTIKIIKQ